MKAIVVLNLVVLLGLLIACGGSAPVAAPTSEAPAVPLTITSDSPTSTPLPPGKIGGEAGALRIDIYSTDAGRIIDRRDRQKENGRPNCTDS